MPDLQLFAATFLRLFEEHQFEHTGTESIQSLSLDDAYAVQQMVIDARIGKGEQIVGYKVGCTSKAIRQQFGLSEPICGCLMVPHVYHGDTVLQHSDFFNCAVEPEFVLRIGKDLNDEVGIFINDAPAASGIGADIMGSPMMSLRWLVNHLVRRGDSLKVGQFVIPGSPVELVSVASSDRVSARLTHVGSVDAEFK